MKIKICGMKYRENLEAVTSLAPDYTGFIFYEKSPRCMRETLTKEDVMKVPKEIKKTGVFVNAKTEEIKKAAENYGLDAIQLHGNESAKECEALKKEGMTVIKAFGINSKNSLTKTPDYRDVVDFFLFDASGPAFGGNGIPFDWSILNDYNLPVPFFLSGGIGLENIKDILDLNLEMLYGVDANSRLEIEPGFKDIDKVKQFINSIKKNEQIRS